MELNKDSKSYILAKKFIKKLKKRVENIHTKRKVIEEMVMTEQTYIKGLEWLIKWRDLCLEEKIAKQGDIEILFSSVIDNIKLISEQILATVTKSFENWEKDSTIGDKFMSFAPFLKQYKDYCKNNEKSGRMLKKLIENQKFKDFVAVQEKE